MSYKEMKALSPLLFLFLFGCRQAPLSPVYDCTTMTVEEQKLLTEDIEACPDEACREAVLVTYCKEMQP